MAVGTENQAARLTGLGFSRPQRTAPMMLPMPRSRSIRLNAAKSSRSTSSSPARKVPVCSLSCSSTAAAWVVGGKSATAIVMSLMLRC